MDDRRLDLNLMQIVHAVLAERSVTRAARRLSMTQPAVSNALNRARLLFDDPIVVRVQGGIRPTERALAMWPELESALTALRNLSRSPSFLPSVCDLTFNIAVTDALADLVPKLVISFGRAAPIAHLRIHPHTDATSLADLDRGSLDWAVGIFPDPPANLHARTLFAEDYVCVMRAAHPHARLLTLEGYLSERHVIVAPSGSTSGLSRLGAEAQRRNVAHIVTHFADALPIVQATDLLTTIPRRIAITYKIPGLVICNLPFPTERIRYKLLWHERTERSQPQQWLRDLATAIFIN